MAGPAWLRRGREGWWHSVRLDNCTSLSHLGLVGKSRSAQRGFSHPIALYIPSTLWSVSCLTSPHVLPLPGCSPGPSHMLTVILNANPSSQRPPVPPMDQTQKQVWGFVSKELEKEPKPENLVLWAKLQTPQPKSFSSQGQHKWSIQDIGVTVFTYPKRLGGVLQDL